jgi:putative ABC transport system ATP-binding protein
MTSNENSDAIIRVESVSKHYADGDVRALREVSTSVGRGEYVAVMGHSGSGKSTLLNIMGALDRPTGGEVYFEGHPVSEMRDPARLRARKIGYVFQSFLLIPTLTAIQNVQISMFEGPLRASQRAERARRLLRLVNMSHRADHVPAQLSVGERQRVAIARALANDPLVLLADEPTGNLDSANTEEVLDLFSRLHEEQGVTLVAVTHCPEVARRADRIIRMRDGRIVEDLGRDAQRPAPPNLRSDNGHPAESRPASSEPVRQSWSVPSSAPNWFFGGASQRASKTHTKDERR